MALTASPVCASVVSVIGAGCCWGFEGVKSERNSPKFDSFSLPTYFASQLVKETGDDDGRCHGLNSVASANDSVQET